MGKAEYSNKTGEHIQVSPTSSLLTRKVKEAQIAGHTICKCKKGLEQGIVLDPFMGSGTTAVVALKLNRRFIGIEVNQKYIDMSLKRIKRNV